MVITTYKCYLSNKDFGCQPSSMTSNGPRVPRTSFPSQEWPKNQAPVGVTRDCVELSLGDDGEEMEEQEELRGSRAFAAFLCESQQTF